MTSLQHPAIAAPKISTSRGYYSGNWKFRDIQRHIFLADFVERADDAALEDRPKALNRIRVDGADKVLATAVAHKAVRIFFAKLPIAAVVIGRDQADPVGNRFANKAFQVSVSAVSMTRATTLPRRCTAPTTVVLPEAGPPGLPSPRLLRCLFRFFQPT